MTGYTPEEEAFYNKRSFTIAVNDAAVDRPHKKTNVSETSKQAYREIQPDLSPKQKELYELLSKAKRPACDLEISKALGWSINSTTGRRNELVDMGKVKEAFKDINPATNKRVCYWSAV
jgi:hypothetical protein